MPRCWMTGQELGAAIECYAPTDDVDPPRISQNDGALSHLGQVAGRTPQHGTVNISSGLDHGDRDGQRPIAQP